MPRVSVIIPAFNAEEHIEQAMRSVLGQSYGDWEIVVCDDCSTDGTADIARAFGDRVTLVRTDGNSGPAAARNLAIRHSRGELLALLDADDYWLPDYLERQVSLCDSGKNVGIVACNAALLRAGALLPETYMGVVRFPREPTLRRVLQANPFLSVLTPRRVVDEVGGFCPELARAQASTSGSGFSRPTTEPSRRARSWPSAASTRSRGRTTSESWRTTASGRTAERWSAATCPAENVESHAERCATSSSSSVSSPKTHSPIAGRFARCRCSSSSSPSTLTGGGLLPRKLARGRDALVPDYRSSASQATTR